MTIALPQPRVASGARWAGLGRRWRRQGWEPVIVAGLVIALRLPFVGAPPSPDEAGFLMVGQQWNGAGSSLYGSYWVDRPPLLITVFRLAAQLGGVVPLRLIGAVAAAMTVLGIATLTRLLLTDPADSAGREHPSARTRSASTRSATRVGVLVASAVAGALSVTPLMGAISVNGELLAAPFVCWGVVGFVRAMKRRGTERLLPALGAGAGLAAAVLVKQNFLDVAVFVVAVLAISVWRREIHRGTACLLAAAVGGGAVLGAGMIAFWTHLHGTSLLGVYDAMYPFRLAAAKVLAATPNPHLGQRAGQLLGAFAGTGAPLLLVAAARPVFAERRDQGRATWLPGSLVTGLLAMLGFAAFSIAGGGNSWLHYLLQLVIPISVLAGIGAARGGLLPRLAAVGLVLVCLASLPWGGGVYGVSNLADQATGLAVASAAHPGDTILGLHTHATVARASGLASPYPYQWSLPADVLDPKQQLLERTLTGPQAPTWVVLGKHGLPSSAPAMIRDAVANNYHLVKQSGSHPILLHDGLNRRIG